MVSLKIDYARWFSTQLKFKLSHKLFIWFAPRNQPSTYLKEKCCKSSHCRSFCIVTMASRGLAHCCYRHFWGFTYVTTQQPVSLRHNFTLRSSTWVYGSRILSSIYIYMLLTLDTSTAGTSGTTGISH